jgi:hypothetical protein
MAILPEELALHRARFTTSAGEWLIVVDNVKQTQGNDNLLLNLILEQGVEEELLPSRKLGLVFPAAVALDPETSAQVIDQIREWIETTDGDGFLDLVHHGS